VFARFGAIGADHSKGAGTMVNASTALAIETRRAGKASKYFELLLVLSFVFAHALNRPHKVEVVCQQGSWARA
jgi:hypothetical protein